MLTDRTRSSPWGIFGGHSARPSRFYRNPATPDEVMLASKSTTKLDADDVVSVQTPGGGGYGDPLERAPSDVLDDVLDEKVSIEKAREEYGVVIGDDSIDEEATAERREEIRDMAANDGGENA